MASWPHWYAPNPYLDLLYGAMEPHGVVHLPGLPLEPRALLEHEPSVDALHLHWPEPFWREGGAATALRRYLRVGRLRRRLAELKEASVAVVWTVHNLRHHEGAGTADVEGYRMLHGTADLRVFHSEWARSVALEAHGGAGDTLVVPHGNYDRAYPRPAPRRMTRRELGVGQDQTLLLCFGQLRRYKGFDLAVEAVDLLDRHWFHLVVAGRPLDGHAERLRSLCAGHPAVSLMAREIGAQRLVDLLGAADLVLLPYRHVTSSGALLLALSSGRGVVATSLPYFREVLAGEPDAAVLVPGPDPRGLRDGIRALLRVPRRRRSEAARRLADRYDWATVVAPLGRWFRERSLHRAAVTSHRP